MSSAATEMMQPNMPAPLTVCTDYPPVVNSFGMWSRSESWRVNVSSPFVNFSFPLQNYTVPMLEFEMCLIFVLTQLSHFFLKMFGLPVFAAQLLAGVLLGDAGFNRMIRSNPSDHMSLLFPYVNQEVLNTLAMYGYALFSFLIGVKMDVGLVSKTGKKAIYTGAITLAVPLLAGVGTLTLLYFNWSFEMDDIFQLTFVISMQSLSTSPVISCLLTDLKILNSELGRLALSTALVSDIAMVSLTSLATWSKVMQGDLTRGIMDLVVMIVFTLFVWYFCRPIMFWMVKQTPEGKPVKELYIYIIILGCMCSGLLSYWCDLPFVNGPLILGLAVPDGPPLGATLVKKLDFMTTHVFMPVFVTTAMMRVTMSLHLPSENAVMATAILTLVIFGGKVLASLVTPLCCKMPLRDAMALALIMCSKGVVEISAYTYARDTRLLSNEIYNAVMLTIVLSAILVPLIVTRLYDPKKKYATYQNRNIMHSNPDSELRILACINRTDNIPAIINLLDASCPTRESPIGLYVLHLIELVARTAPILISHNVQKKSFSNYKHSENVILSFSNYKRENQGAISLQVFTALSPPRYMYDDVCTLAIDKVTSIIILPFHRKWSTIDDSVESENKNVRNLNCSVLETAPCSVGILVNRGHINSSVTPEEPYRVALIFLGGSDDREALSFAERMVKDTCISLTVIRLVDVSGDEEGYDSWQWVQDNEMLKEIRHNRAGYVSYVEEEVEDGTQTADKMRSLMDEDEYDLFIVGRRYNVRSSMTMGLEEWSEFPELGVIGDMLSSADCSCHSNVFIIQQQQQRRNNIKASPTIKK